jgi:hypothetical protein
MSKILGSENQSRAWNAVGYEGAPSIQDVTMLDVYQWEEEVMLYQLEVKDRLGELLQMVDKNIDEKVAQIEAEKEELTREEESLEESKEVLHEILLSEGYPNGLYFDDESIAA